MYITIRLESRARFRPRRQEISPLSSTHLTALEFYGIDLEKSVYDTFNI
jgi:hypothetical protein